MPDPLLSEDAARSLVARYVSRETLARLDTFAHLCLRWNARINLIAPSTVSQLWRRHILDSLQLLEHVPSARRWIDLGSGGGFPGLVIACALADQAGSQIALVESNGKKSAFLRESVRVLSLPVIVLQSRIEDAMPSLATERWDVVSARALTSLSGLFQLSYPVLSTGAIGLFPKGQDVDEELLAARSSWQVVCDLIQSQTDAQAKIVRVTRLQPANASFNPLL